MYGMSVIKREIATRRESLKHALHALKEEAAENITAEQVETGLKAGFEVIEGYPDDPRGCSCLVLFSIDNNPFHAVCAPHEDALIIITVYRPDLNRWRPNYKTRQEK
jgi:hypothetical protein